MRINVKIHLALRFSSYALIARENEREELDSLGDTAPVVDESREEGSKVTDCIPESNLLT